VIPSLSAVLSVVYAMYRMGKKFGAMEERFKHIDERFESLKLYIDARFNEIDKRFSDMDRRFNELRDYVDKRFNELKEYVDTRITRLGKAFSSYQEFFVEYLSVKGVVSEEEATMLKNEASKLSSQTVANLEEAEEFRELGRKAVAEYWSR
jgi:hypothetical protein